MPPLTVFLEVYEMPAQAHFSLGNERALHNITGSFVNLPDFYHKAYFQPCKELHVSAGVSHHLKNVSFQSNRVILSLCMCRLNCALFMI